MSPIKTCSVNAVFESTVQNMSHFIYFHSYRKVLRPKEVLKLYQARLFQCVQTDFNWGEWSSRNGNCGDHGRSYQCCRSIAIIDYLSSKFILCSDIFNSYNPRDCENKLAVPLPWTSYYRNTFCHNGAVLWNSLPSNRTSKIPRLSFGNF